MDSITQGLLGAAVAECGFRHKLGRGATLMGAAAGVLPDLDIALSWIDPWWTWQYHRHFTHSILFAPLVALPLAWLFWRRGDRRHFGLWCLCAYLALATHPMLDLCTTYGTQLLAPISNARFGLDWIGIIDPFYTLVLITTLVGCVLRRRTGHSNSTWRVAVAGMVLSTGYLFYGALNHHWAMARIHQHARQHGHQVLAARAIPNVGSLFVWRLIYRTESGHYVGRTNTRFGRPAKFVHLPIETGPLVRKADEQRLIQIFRTFTMGWARPYILPGKSGPRVVYDDLRYGWPPDDPHSLWSAVVEFDEGSNVVSVRRGRFSQRGDGSAGKMWRSFWYELGRP